MAAFRYKLWIILSAIFQIITSAMHSLSLINEPIPTNDQEKQLFGLMKSVRIDLGAGFTPNMGDLMTSFSVAFTLLLLFGGLLNILLLSKKADLSLMKSILLLQVVIFGICFLAIWYYTFIIPIICTGLIFVALLISWILTPKSSSN